MWTRAIFTSFAARPDSRSGRSTSRIARAPRTVVYSAKGTPRMLQLLRLLPAIFLAAWMFQQVRKPSGWLGRRVVQAMNLSHATMADWGLRQVTVPKNAVILDVGCGGGWTVRRLAAWASEGTVIGLDYSAASVAVSRDTNATEIEAGRVQIERGSVDALPFPDRTFDIVTAVETHYYWPDLPANVREILRVLRPGGTFALIAETYRGGPFSLLYGMVMPLLRAAFLSDAEHRELLSQAGFIEVATMHLSGRNWICATGRRPL
jgi:ubiquinone/menaquinone biosynthesis C-methylase UbiE